MMTANRVDIDHLVMGGVPCIRGTRIPVATVLGLLAEGVLITEVLDIYPHIEAADVLACLAYAAVKVDGRYCS